MNDKLRTYCLLKNNHEIESYMMTDIPKAYRSKLALLRVGSLNIEIEKGRYLIPTVPPHKRFCRFCPNQIGDECHFLICCSRFDEKRSELLTKLGLTDTLRNKSSLERYKFLLTNELKLATSCYEIGKFVHECYKIHSTMES